MFGGVEPVEGGLEILSVECGAARGGLVAFGSEVEEDAGAEAGDAIGIAVLVLVIIGPLALWLNVRDRRKTR